MEERYNEQYQEFLYTAQQMIARLIRNELEAADRAAIQAGTYSRYTSSKDLDSIKNNVSAALESLVDVPSAGANILVEGLASALYLREIGAYYPE